MIQWYPGHMEKAKREVIEKMNPVDIIFELVDARLPFSSRNPMLDGIINNKPSLLIFNKVDMADEAVTREWVNFFNTNNKRVVLINSKEAKMVNNVIREAETILEAKINTLKAKGVRPRSMRAMVVGIPNVGKSTFINRIAKKNIAKTGNIPGVTRAQQWIKLNKAIDLLDTPGILWPKFDDIEIGYKLALSGAIKDTILDLSGVAYYGLSMLAEKYPGLLYNHFKLTCPLEKSNQVFNKIGVDRGFLTKNGVVDIERTVAKIVSEFRNLQVGNISFETPTSLNNEDNNNEDSATS